MYSSVLASLALALPPCQWGNPEECGLSTKPQVCEPCTYSLKTTVCKALPITCPVSLLASPDGCQSLVNVCVVLDNWLFYKLPVACRPWLSWPELDGGVRGGQAVALTGPWTDSHCSDVALAWFMGSLWANSCRFMMTSRHGNVFLITDPLWEVASYHWTLLKKGLVVRSFDVSLNKLLNKLLRCQCFETPWRSCDFALMLQTKLSMPYFHEMWRGWGISIFIILGSPKQSCLFTFEALSQSHSDLTEW